MKNTAIAYWLIPAKPERELFHKIIRILAKQYEAPRFEPHLTVLVTPQDRRSPRQILERVEAAPIRLSILGIGFSSKFTKTLFVRFKSSNSLEKLIADLVGAGKSRLESRVDPHVSLIYKKLPQVVKRGLASSIKLPFSEVLFDSIKAIPCASPTRDRADVEAWRVVAKKALSKTR